AQPRDPPSSPTRRSSDLAPPLSVVGTDVRRPPGLLPPSSPVSRTIGWPASSALISSPDRVSYSSRPLASVCRSSRCSVRVLRARSEEHTSELQYVKSSYA